MMGHVDIEGQQKLAAIQTAVGRRMHTVHLLSGHGADGGRAVIEGVGQILYESIFVGGGRIRRRRPAQKA
jgi:hypothetical protein